VIESEYLRALRDVPVTQVGLLTVHGKGIPLAVLDARTRPDLRDLVRVHQTEGGEGDQEHTWRVVLTPAGLTIILDLALIRPVRCRFCLLFDVSQRFDWLTLVARSGSITTTTRPVTSVADALDTSIVWLIDPAPLIEVLTGGSLAALRKKSRGA